MQEDLNVHPPPPTGADIICIVFGSVIDCVLCVISCECDNFLIIWNFTFKLEPCIDHI